MKPNIAKTIFLTILAIVTVVCIIIGTITHVTHKNPFINDGVRTLDDSEVETAEYDVEAFERIDMDMEVGNVTLSYGDSYHVKYEFSDRIAPVIQVKQGVMTIEEKTGSFHVTDLESVKCDLYIQIPRGKTLQKVEADLDLGNFIYDSVEAKHMEIECDLGNIEIREAVINNVDLQASLGNIELINGTYGKVECEADLGNIEVRGDITEITAVCDLGDVTITEVEKGKATMDIQVDLGELEVNGNKMGTKYKQ